MPASTRNRRPPVRVRPAPPLDPPFDDDVADLGLPDGAQLALELTGGGTGVHEDPRASGGSTGRASARRGLTGPTGSTGPAGPAGPRPEHPRLHPPPPTRLPPEAQPGASLEARRSARRFLDTCLEIINGFRPVAHVRPLSEPTAAYAIISRLTVGVGRAKAVRRAARGRPAELVRLRRLRVSEPRPGVVEAVAVLGGARQSWALAFRLEHRRGAWVGTAIDVV